MSPLFTYCGVISPGLKANDKLTALNNGIQRCKIFSLLLQSSPLLPPHIISFNPVGGSPLIFFSRSFFCSDFTPSILFCPSSDFFFSLLPHRWGWLPFFKNLSLPSGVTGPSISEPQAHGLEKERQKKMSIKIGFAKK